MQFSQSTEYAIHSLFYLALQGKDKMILVGDVAKAHGISESYLAKVFQSLTKAGLIKSFRGAKGGYVLAMAPAEITLRRIVETIEGRGPFFVCDEQKRNCSFLGDCIIRNVMDEAEKRMFAVLENTTLADLVARLQSDAQVATDLQKKPGTHLVLLKT